MMRVDRQGDGIGFVVKVKGESACLAKCYI